MSKKPEPTPTVHLAAFGKHPGWDDHIDDLGVETDRLAHVKRQLYGEGIAGNIESGAWGRPQEAPPAGLIPFGHVFLWLVGPDVVVGRLWPSRDGKKPPRTNYPMVVCAQLTGLPLEWAVREVMPRLEALEGRLMSVETQDQVRAALDEMRRELRAAAAGVSGDAAAWRLDPLRLARLAERSEVDGAEGSPGVGLLRVLYEIEKEMADFRPGDPRSWSRSRSMVSRSSHVRVPTCDDPAVAPLGEPMLPWLGLLRAELESATPMLAIRPVRTDGPGWIDLVAGDPTAGSLQCVRVSPEAVPLTTTIPYNLEQTFVAQCADRFAAWRNGRLPGSDRDADPARAAGDRPISTGRPRPRWLRWLGGAGAVVAVGGGALLVLRGNPDPSAEHAAAAPTAADEPPRQPEVTLSPAVATNAAPVEQQASAEAVRAPAEPDPRATWSGERRLADLRTRAQRLAGGSAAAAELADAEDRARRVADLAAQLRSLNADDHAGIRSLMADADAQIDGIATLLDRAEALAATAPAAPIDAAGPSMEEARARLLARDRIVDDAEAINAAWVRWRDELIAAADDPRAMESAAAALRAGLVRLAESVPPPPRFSGEHADGLHAAARRERDRVLAEHLAEAKPWRNGAWHEPDAAASPAWSTRAASLAAWDTALVNAAADLADAGRLLAAGSLPDEPSASEGPAARFAKWENAPALAAMEENAPSLVRPVREELARLADVAAAASTDAVLAAIGGGDPSASVARAAWRRLGQLPPAPDAASLRRLLDLADRSLRALAAADPQHREARATEVRAAFVERCIATLDRLSGASECEAAAAMFADLRLNEADLDRLSAPARYNLALAAARASVRSLQTPADEQTLREHLGRFLQTVDRLPAVGALAAAAPVIAGVRESLAAPGPESAALERLGPGSRGWKVEPLDGPDRVRYVWTAGGKTSSAVEFALVRLGNGAQRPPRLTYVSTEEVSFALFAAAVTSADGWELVKPLLRSWDPNLGRDPRQGPRVWDWRSDQRRIPPIRLADGWLTQPSDEDSTNDRPDEGHPIQHISAPAAVLTARLLGCRVPSYEEWRAALESEGGVEGVASRANRRDAAWRRYADRAPAADAGVFIPGDATSGPTGALSIDDGAVWFRPTADGGGRTFRHLVGNVAELIALRPEEMEQAAATPEAAVLAVGGETPGVAVVGGSALSPTDLEVDQPLPIGPRTLREGRADLGFRLAFAVPDAPTEPLAARAGAWLEGAEYLPPDP